MEGFEPSITREIASLLFVGRDRSSWLRSVAVAILVAAHEVDQDLPLLLDDSIRSGNEFSEIAYLQG